MARIIEAEGATIDEAIFKGLEQLKLSIDEVELFIIDEGAKGFLGIGNRLAKVRLEEREEAIVPEFLKEKPKTQTSERPRRDRREKSEFRDRKEKSEFHDRKDRSDSMPQVPAGPYFPEGTEFVENEVTEFLKGLMEKMGVEGTIQAAQTENGLLVNLEGPNMGMLIGRRGETLDAIQYLCSLVYNKGKDDYHRVTVDTENYRKKREQTLIRLARRMASQVTKTGKNVVLEPMSPFERRIIHFALQNDRYVETVSDGEDPNRHVIIQKKDAE